MHRHHESSNQVFLAALSGMCAVFIGLGLGRFAYSPLVPAMVSAGWFSIVDAGHLITVNLVGYFLGALFLKFFANKISPSLLTKLALIICAIGLFGRAYGLGLPWFIIIRFFLGFFGAVLMIITPSYVLTAVPIAKRNTTSAIIFSGLGLGILVSGLLVAGFAKGSAHFIWLLFGFVGLFASVVCWLYLPPNADLTRSSPICAEGYGKLSSGIKYLIIAYTFIAMAYVPPLLFLVDYLTMSQGYSHANASLIYAGLGMGAMLGSVFGNWLARLFGLYYALLGVIGCCVIATLLVFCPSSFLVVSAVFLLGLFFTCMVMLISVRLLELEGAEKHANLWGMMTIGFAIGQAVSSYLTNTLDHIYAWQGASFIFAAVMFFVSFIFLFLAKNSAR